MDLHISTVCLPPQGEIPQSRNCYATGWGKDEFGKRGKYSVIMKRVKLPIVDRQTCEEELQETRLTHAFRLHESFICAGGEEGVDTCQVNSDELIGKTTEMNIIDCTNILG